jgi:hypothetical protein
MAIELDRDRRAGRDDVGHVLLEGRELELEQRQVVAGAGSWSPQNKLAASMLLA